MTQPTIETTALSVYYGRQRGIHDLNMTVTPGEVYGFLGPNGAGKSTTLRVLLDIIRPTSGRATVFGLDCRRDGVEIRRRVGYIPGELMLYGQLRADQYLDMVARVSGSRDDPDYRRRLCALLDLDAGRLMHTYSRGNKQKVGLVAAFMRRPDLLILDEPTSGLDPLIQQNVLDLVREARADGRTVLFSSHVLSEVQEVCDRVGIIRAGQMVATEQVEQLIKSRLQRLHIRLAQMPPSGALDGDGVSEIGRTADTITFEVRANLNRLLAQAVAYDVLELDNEQVTLEDIFMTYYSRNGGTRHD